MMTKTKQSAAVVDWFNVFVTSNMNMTVRAKTATVALIVHVASMNDVTVSVESEP